MKRKKPKGKSLKKDFRITVTICDIKHYPDKEQADLAAKLLRFAGIQASTEPADIGRPDISYRGDDFPLFIAGKREDFSRARHILELSTFLESRTRLGPVHLPPEEGSMENLDMLIHDCRQYLLIAEGKIKDISEEGELELDDPTNDIYKITIRLKRLKSQCMRQAGKRPLDWEHGGGLGKF